MNHYLGEGYSGARPVPTVDGYLKQQQENSTDSINYDRSLPPTPAAVPSSNAPPPQEPPSNVPASQPPSTHTGTSDKERILAQSKKQTPLEQAQAKKRDGQLVDDPTTGGQVHLEPSKAPKDKETYGKQLDPANMDHAGPALTPPQELERYLRLVVVGAGQEEASRRDAALADVTGRVGATPETDVSLPGVVALAAAAVEADRREAGREVAPLPAPQDAGRLLVLALLETRPPAGRRLVVRRLHLARHRLAPALVHASAAPTPTVTPDVRQLLVGVPAAEVEREDLGTLALVIVLVRFDV
ncbi:hypothetical protein FIBSPDRAFT_944823 [Athelia psychrophila]|uniref:Uncharacterized protein n=1 Tax=Athelia psychrophila TaxID=1759441 RepID=A0A166UJF5_9AGAM|nr:hypothetical protein FIBSPDRAFT_944823 [Fibularhizoctonia sp. CBS 109695]